jgi:hypothetical protein
MRRSTVVVTALLTLMGADALAQSGRVRPLNPPILLSPLQGLAQQSADVSKTDRQQAAKEQDGQRNFAFHFGTWKSSKPH